MPERWEENDMPSYSVQAAIYKYVFASKFLSNDRVLDIACGIGYGSNIIYKINPKVSIIAGDIYLKGLIYGKKKINEKIEFTNLDILHLPYKDNSFDVVITFETLEHIINLDSYLKEINRVLKSEGVFLCSTPNKKFSQRVGIKNEFHVKEYSHDELKNYLEIYFKDINSYGQKEIASDLVYRFPLIYKIYNKLRPILIKLFKVKDIKKISAKKLNSKFEVKDFWQESPYLIFSAKNKVKQR
jgi:ubiquinone/menaquinone biosynthesis C-methylase UbiE